MKKNLWHALASGNAAIALLAGTTATLSATGLQYRIYGMHRVQLQLFDQTLNLALWSITAFFLTLFTLLYRRRDRAAILLGIMSSIAPAIAAGSEITRPASIFAGELLLLLFIYFITRTDRAFIHQTWLGVAALLILVESLALLHWLVFPYYPDIALVAAQFDTNLAYLGYGLVKPLFVLVSLSWIPFILPSGVVSRLVSAAGWFAANLRSSSLSGKSLLLSLLIVSIFSAAVGYYPYVRITTRLVGGDIQCCYMPTLQRVLEDGPTFLYGSDRIFFYSVLYLGHLATGASAFAILMVLPAVLTVMTSLATFVFVRLGLRNPPAAVTAGLVSALSFNTTAAIFMDLFANWFANAILLLSLGMLLHAYRGGRHEKPAGALAVCSSVLILFSHALVWWAMLGIVALFTLASVMSDRTRRRTRLLFLAVFLAANFAAYQFRLMLGTSGSVLDANVVAADYSKLVLGLIDGSIYGPFWSNLDYFIDRTSIFYGNSLLLILAIAGTVFIARARTEAADFRWMLGAWMLVGGVLTVTLSTILSPYYSSQVYWPLVWRGLFMLPIQIPAGILLGALLASRSGRVAYAVLVLVLINFAFRTLATTIIV